MKDKEKKIDVDVPGEFNPTEESILEFLYTHPTGDYGTFFLLRELRPEKEADSDERKVQAFKEVQDGIETLIVAKLAKGKRLRANSGAVYFENLILTPSGEAEAIRQKRRVKKIVVDIQHVGEKK